MGGGSCSGRGAHPRTSNTICRISSLVMVGISGRQGFWTGRLSRARSRDCLVLVTAAGVVLAEFISIVFIVFLSWLLANPHGFFCVLSIAGSDLPQRPIKTDTGSLAGKVSSKP
jgi:hypothetical protein